MNDIRDLSDRDLIAYLVLGRRGWSRSRWVIARRLLVAAGTLVALVAVIVVISAAIVLVFTSQDALP